MKLTAGLRVASRRHLDKTDRLSPKQEREAARQAMWSLLEKKKFHSAAQQVSACAIQRNQFISTSHFHRVATDCEILIFVSLLTQTSKTYSKCLNKWRLDFFKCSSYTIVWTGSVKDKPRVTFPLYRDTNLSVITHTPWPITQLKQESVCGRWSRTPGTDVPRTMISHPTERGRGVSKMVQLCHIRRHPP